MKTFILIITLISNTCILAAQESRRTFAKPPIDTANLFNWPIIAGWPYPIFSGNGEYFLYSLWGVPRGGATMIIQALNKNWQAQLTGVNQAQFTNDSRRVIFITPNDSLCILTLSDTQRIYIPKVSSFKLFMKNNTEMLTYQLSNQHKELILLNLTSAVQQVYKSVNNYIFSEDGSSMVLQTEPDTANSSTLQWIDILTNESTTIWKGKGVSNLRLHQSGKRLAFLVQDSMSTNNRLFLYNSGQKKAIELLKNRLADIAKEVELTSIDNFSEDGEKLFVQIKKRSLSSPPLGNSPIKIWSYQDSKLQPLQAGESAGATPSYLAVLDLQSEKNFWQIQQENETVTGNATGEFVLLTLRKGKASERYWNTIAAGSTYLAIVNKEKRIPIPLSQAKISPGHKYIVGYGPGEIWGGDLFIYEIATNILKNITKDLPFPTTTKESDIVETNSGKGLRLAGWLPEDSSLLVYDYNDIWQVDPSCKRKPIRLTNGRKRNLQFRLAEDDVIRMGKVIEPEHMTMLTAFNTKTKQQGFYRMKWFATEEPEYLFMGDCIFTKIGESNCPFVKARDRNIFLLRREQTDQAPNIFSTTDFKTFSQATHICPENSVNWVTSELINFITSDGVQTQAILYKPENFNPGRRYPLLIHYYDKKSNQLNKYQFPVSSDGGDLDVAWFVSHGYLVLLTDIHYEIGRTGENVYNTVVGAARYLSKRDYVDKHHIGIQGHSFGGYETNYLITHSNLFAAAVSSAGVPDLVSCYGSLWPDGSSLQEYFESRAFRVDGPPWKTRAFYINNSSIFSATNVITPVLLIHNKRDKNVMFEQGIEFFTALRRTGKQAWMLQYDNGGHGQGGEDYTDYLLRTTQFFDHYLKGAPAPEWMTRGIPATMKGIDNGLSLDKNTTLPGNSILTSKDVEK